MAALQTLRSKPALLMSVIGGALLLFIITMVMENNSGLFGVSDEAGEAFGNEIKVNDLESKISEEQNLQEIATFLNNFFQTGQMDYQRLTEEQRAQIRQTVWDNFVNHGAIEQEANKLGLIVTDAEMQAALKTPTTFEAQFLMMVGQFAYSNPTIEGYKKENITTYTDFITELDKMRDFFEMSKEEFLLSYSYLEEIEYNLTAAKLKNMTTEEIVRLKSKCDELPDYD